jgi:hypothetical protein
MHTIELHQVAWYIHTCQVSWRLIQALKQYVGFVSEILEAAILVLFIYDMSLRWFHVAWYIWQVSWRLVEAFKQYSDFASVIWEGIILVLLIEGIYEVRRWDGLRWHDINTKFYRDWAFQKLIRGIHMFTETASWSHKIIFIFQNKESRLNNGYSDILNCNYRFHVSKNI